MINKPVANNLNNEFLPAVRRARYEQLTIYEITDMELDILEKGSPDSVFLNFAIFLLSVSFSLIVTLLTTTINTQIVMIVFVVFIIIGILGGFLLLLMWIRNRTSVTKCVKNIRNRLTPEEGIFEEL
jgi:hypothetical protein